MKERDFLNHLLGKYIAFAVNDPKKYPKKPYLENMDGTKKRVMTSEEMEAQARRNTLILGGKVD